MNRQDQRFVLKISIKIMDSDSSWEAHSITEEILCYSSEDEDERDLSDSSDVSSPEDDDQEQEVRGAEPYHFEPVSKSILCFSVPFL